MGIFSKYFQTLISHNSKTSWTNELWHHAVSGVNDSPHTPSPPRPPPPTWQQNVTLIAPIFQWDNVCDCETQAIAIFRKKKKTKQKRNNVDDWTQISLGIHLKPANRKVGMFNVIAKFPYPTAVKKGGRGFISFWIIFGNRLKKAVPMYWHRSNDWMFEQCIFI